MTNRSRLLDLMERKVAAALAAERAKLGRLAQQVSEAAQMAQRLASLQQERQRDGDGLTLAADLRLNLRLRGEIASASHHHDARLGALRRDLASQRDRLAREDHRRDLYAKAGAAARLAEAEGAEAREQAQQPPARALR